MIYEYKCTICGARFDVVQGVNDVHEAFHCGFRSDRVWCLFHTNKDLMYQFKTKFNNRTTEIHSKRQYNRVLKENGMVQVTSGEIRSVKPKDNAEKPRNDLINRVSKKLHSEGLGKAFPKYIKDFYGRKSNSK